MDAAFFGAAVTPILTNLSSFVIEEIGLASSVKQDLNNLKKKVKLISALLRDAEKGPNSKQECITLWVQEMTDAIYDADDVLEEINYAVLHQQRKQDNIIKRAIDPIVLPFYFSHKIKNINMRLDLVVKDGTNLGLTQVLLQPKVAGESSARHDRQTTPFGDVSNILGRDGDKSKVLDMLLQSSVVAIIGLAGLGKTALAKLIYNDTDRIKFGERIWVCVSDDFSVTTILKDMAVNLEIKIQDTSKLSLIKDLTKKLCTRKYLLILDDVWNTDAAKWNDLTDCLFGIGADKESKILVTTRSDKVASVMHCLSSFKLAGLSEDDSWSLFRQKTFSHGGPKETTSATKIGQRIVNRCKGVPLAILTIGALLNSKHENEWSSIENSDLWDLSSDESGIMSALRLSYNHFPSSYLKQCFAYCSIFPKDSVLKKDNMIQLWIAQGFIESAPGSKIILEDTGNDYFNILVWNSFFQDVEIDRYGKIKTCKMHDLVHDLAQSISKLECLVLDTNNANDSLSVRHLHFPENEGTMPKIPNGHKLRTLFLSCEVRENVLGKFKCLHVLNFENSSYIKKLPKSIGKLKSLRYLNISDTGIKEFPNSILKLYSLQTIRFKRCEIYGELPNQLKSMVSLTHLCFDPYYIERWKRMPFLLGSLTSLQTLSGFIVGRRKGYMIEELGSLNKLRGKLHVKQLEHVRDKNDAKSSNLSKKIDLLKLILEWSRERSNCENMDEDVLEGLQPPPNLGSLTIDGFNGNNFPTWMLTTNASNYLLPDSLVEIKLMNCDKCERIPTLGELPFLKFLHIKHMKNLKSIGKDFYSSNKYYGNKLVCHGEASSSCITLFPSLQKLELIELNNLVEWSEAPTIADMAKEGGTVVVFPSLTCLKIESMLTLNHLPEDLLKNSKNLTNIYIDDCSMLECIGMYWM